MAATQLADATSAVVYYLVMLSISEKEKTE